eukprot:GDKI01007909.1.p1 GENE.GDKI01007909.1~~GDKI01007909.1.p1  ORF type:complete len:413 (-),score=56.67 GDKI01007909.1:23-1261(-)
MGSLETCQLAGGSNESISLKATVISIIIPVHNAEFFIGETLESIYNQSILDENETCEGKREEKIGPEGEHKHVRADTHQQDDGTCATVCVGACATPERVQLEVCIYNDGSTDKTMHIINEWSAKLQQKGVIMRIGTAEPGQKGGVGFAKNKAVSLSTGEYLCFQDADDIMMRDRVKLQYTACKHMPGSIIGSRFERLPADSTHRYTLWLNTLTPEQLYTQRFRECTLAMPTWFMHKSCYLAGGKFKEDPTIALPEDLMFLYAHTHKGGGLHRVDEPLVVYRYHENCMSFRVDWRDIWSVRLEEFQRCVLDKWGSFGVWNAGKEGRHFFRSLSEANRNKVCAFYDVDETKINQKFYVDPTCKGKGARKIPIKHWSEIKPPFVTCVKFMLTGGVFEEYLASLQLREGIDYFHFS